MATVTVRTQSGETEVLTTATYRSWKRRNGRQAAFVLENPVEHLVHTFAEMQRLPAGDYEAVFVMKCAPPEQVRKQLRGTDLWRCV